MFLLSLALHSLGIGCNAISHELSRKNRNLKEKKPSLHKILTIAHSFGKLEPQIEISDRKWN